MSTQEKPSTVPASELIETLGVHSRLGAIKITEQCLALQALNPDPSSVFVEHDGEVKEVSKALVRLHP